MSVTEEVEFDDSDMVCSTSREPEMCYGESDRILKLSISIAVTRTKTESIDERV